MEQQVDRKRKFLLVMPLMVVPFITLLFYSLGGGTEAAAMAPKQNGLNTNIPAAAIPGDNPLDKLSIYQQADRDSIRREEQLKHDGFFNPATEELLSGNEGSVARSYAGDDGNGITASRYGRRGEVTSEAKIERRLAELQRELGKMDTTSHRPGVLPNYDNINGTPQQMQQLEDMVRAMSGPVPGAAPDPEMAQLNTMLDKVLRITNPELAREEVRKASAADKTRVFPVLTTGKTDVTDFFQGPTSTRPAWSQDSTVYRSLDTSRIQSVSSQPINRFFDLDDNRSPITATAISAVIHETQQVVAGATVKLRLEQDIYVQGQLIPAGTFLFGKCALGGDRLAIPITVIHYSNNIYPVSLQVYGLDGQEGVYIEGSITGDVSRTGANDAFQSLQLAAMDPSITQQAAAAGIETVKSLVSKKVKLVKMTLKGGHPVLLVDTNSL